MAILRSRSRISGCESQGVLIAEWEVCCETMGDDYLPSEIRAGDLFLLWAKRMMKDYPDGLISIEWFVSAEGTFERLPFQYDQRGSRREYFTFFTWPKNVAGRKIDWDTIPVQDKKWNAKTADKGGFIQEATGWKPTIYQPFVYLPALLHEEYQRRSRQKSRR